MIQKVQAPAAKKGPATPAVKAAAKPEVVSASAAVLTVSYSLPPSFIS